MAGIGGWLHTPVLASIGRGRILADGVWRAAGRWFISSHCSGKWHAVFPLGEIADSGPVAGWVPVIGVRRDGKATSKLDALPSTLVADTL